MHYGKFGAASAALAVMALVFATANAAVPKAPPQICINKICSKGNSSATTSTTTSSGTTTSTGSTSTGTTSGTTTASSGTSGTTSTGTTTTTTTTTTKTTASASGGVRWAPGHYMLSNEIDRSSSGQMPAILNELSVLANSGGNVVGYAYNATWDTLEPTKSNYDFSHIDNVLSHLPSGKKLIIGVQTGYTPSNHIPTYILTDSTYGASNKGGYGYWTGYGGVTYIGTKWRSAFMARWTALFQALGDRYDGDSRVVALVDRDETAPNMDGGSDYSDSAMFTMWTNFGAQVVPHAQHMSVVQQINWLPGGTERSYMAALYQNRAGFGGPDIFGASIGVNYVAAQAIYDGNVGGVDYRGKMPMIHDVQSPEMTGGLGLYSPTDIVNNANGNLGINYMLWNYLGGGGAGDWYNQVLPAINAHPITHTGCPSSYGSCSSN